MPLPVAPSKADRGASGRKLPLNGAPPEVISIPASSSKVVADMLSPPPPLRLNNCTIVPFGELSQIARSPV